MRRSRSADNRSSKIRLRGFPSLTTKTLPKLQQQNKKTAWKKRGDGIERKKSEKERERERQSDKEAGKQ